LRPKGEENLTIHIDFFFFMQNYPSGMKNKRLFSIGATSLLILTACGGASGIETLATPSDLGIDAKVDSEKFFFASDEKVFPSSDCNSDLFKLLSDAKDFKQTNLVFTTGKGTDLHQQVFTFDSEENATQVLDRTKDLVSSECSEKNSLFSEYVFEPTPTSGFGDGVSGITWTNSGSQQVALSCDGPDPLYFESQIWVIQRGNQVLVTSVSETTCGDNALPLGEEKRTEVGEKAINFALQ
jgi:hypothetical protein